MCNVHFAHCNVSLVVLRIFATSVTYSNLMLTANKAKQTPKQNIFLWNGHVHTYILIIHIYMIFCFYHVWSSVCQILYTWTHRQFLIFLLIQFIYHTLTSKYESEYSFIYNISATIDAFLHYRSEIQYLISSHRSALKLVWIYLKNNVDKPTVIPLI